MDFAGPPRRREACRGELARSELLPTSEALIRCAREHAGEIEPTAGAILAALPLRLGKPMTGVDAND